MEYDFEQGPIRPPSEAKSLLVRVTRNCPWNKCAFCQCYRGRKFELRTVEEIKKDIQRAREIADDIRSLSWKMGEAGEVSRSVAMAVLDDQGRYSDNYRSVAAWLYFGGESVFLQDANSIIMKTDDLLAVLACIKETFPFVRRITSYCRSKTAARKSVEEYTQLRDAGLSRIHIGLESGYDPLLKFMKKGVTAAEHVEGGRRIVESGISLSEYIMPGLGGYQWSSEHARETARVLNEIDPDFIRIRTLQVRRDSELFRLMEEGGFVPLGDEAVVREIRELIANLEGIRSTVVSDHILNLLEEVTGTLPRDREKMIAVIDRYFALSEEDRRIFRLGRRKGIYRGLDDLLDVRIYGMLRSIVAEYRNQEPGRLDRDLYALMSNYI